MKHQTIKGGGGSRLHVVDAGNPRGHPILFIHGFSQCSLCWGRQMSSELGENYRLVAMDMRGHGASDKPRDGYDDSRLWADDVAATIQTLNLDRPILCGWSYGPLVILDYIRHYGENDIGGVHFVAAATKLGNDEAVSVLAPDFLRIVPGLFSNDAVESVNSLEALLRMCFASDVSATDFYTMLGYNVAVPPFVRQALFSRVLDNDDILAALRKPVLITHGADDAVMKREAVERQRASIAHAEIHIIPSAGHASFWDAAASFNQRLGTFCEEVVRGELSPI